MLAFYIKLNITTLSFYLLCLRIPVSDIPRYHSGSSPGVGVALARAGAGRPLKRSSRRKDHRKEARGCVPPKMGFPVLEPRKRADPQDHMTGPFSPHSRVASSHPIQGPFQKQKSTISSLLESDGQIPCSLHTILPLTPKKRQYVLSQLVRFPESPRLTSCHSVSMLRQLGLGCWPLHCFPDPKNWPPKPPTPALPSLTDFG